MSNKTIWVNGCFDLVHYGQIKLLEYAKSLGSYLIVGVDTDERVREKKGDSRPVNELILRMCVLNAIRYVDKVVSFGSDEELRSMISLFEIDIMVLGSDWEGKEIIGGELVKEVKYFPRITGFSTTGIMDKINDTHGSKVL